MKYIKSEYPEVTQSEISDELAKVWIANGNKNISDKPWPNLKMVKAYFVADRPANV